MKVVIMGDVERGIDHGSVAAGGRRGRIDRAFANRAGNPGRAGADILAYREDRSFCGSSGARAASSDGPALRRTRRGRRPRWRRSTIASRPGRELTITLDAKAWLGALACRKTKDLGYPYELWTTRFLAGHAREHGPAEGHACLADLAQGTVCNILGQDEVKPHKVRYYLEQRDPDFAEKMAEVLCVYHEVGLLKKAAARLH
jgi:hypothetical protein